MQPNEFKKAMSEIKRGHIELNRFLGSLESASRKEDQRIALLWLIDADLAEIDQLLTALINRVATLQGVAGELEDAQASIRRGIANEQNG